jgi:hypothetical protein
MANCLLMNQHLFSGSHCLQNYSWVQANTGKSKMQLHEHSKTEAKLKPSPAHKWQAQRLAKVQILSKICREGIKTVQLIYNWRGVSSILLTTYCYKYSASSHDLRIKGTPSSRQNIRSSQSAATASVYNICSCKAKQTPQPQEVCVCTTETYIEQHFKTLLTRSPPYWKLILDM